MLESCREYKGYINEYEDSVQQYKFVGVWIVPFTHVAFTQHLTGSPFWNKIFFALMVDWNL